MGVDDLIRRTQVRDMAMAVILDCGASLMIEEVCNIFQKQIDAETDGYLTSRFSPGYGDYPLEYQQIIVRYIDGETKDRAQCDGQQPDGAAQVGYSAAGDFRSSGDG